MPASSHTPGDGRKWPCHEATFLASPHDMNNYTPFLHEGQAALGSKIYRSITRTRALTTLFAWQHCFASGSRMTFSTLTPFHSTLHSPPWDPPQHKHNPTLTGTERLQWTCSMLEQLTSVHEGILEQLEAAKQLGAANRAPRMQLPVFPASTLP